MSIEPNIQGDYPRIDATAFVHSSAVLIGKVQVGPRVFIGPQAVLRADEPDDDGQVVPIVVGEGINIQDGVVIHALGGTGVTIGVGTSIAHGAIVHGPCTLGTDCFVGFNAVVYNATLGDGVVVMHQVLVEGVAVPDGVHIPSMAAVRCEADVLRLEPVTTDVVTFAERVRLTNTRLAKGYAVTP